MENKKSNCNCTEKRKFERELEKMSPFEIKNKLIAMAQEDARKSSATFLNAGRGNPNWVATTPREAFFLLGKWALAECHITKDVGDGIAGIPSREGSGERFRTFLEVHRNYDGAELLRGAFEYLIVNHNVDPNDVAHEWAEAIIGDQYPTPDRILRYTELLVRDYLAKEMGGCQCDDDCECYEGKDCGCECKSKVYDLFAVEGGTAAMCYAFDSLFENRLLKKGDTIAIMTPVFTPYLEIPHLERFGFNVVNISANKIEEDGLHYWQYPDEEIDKLRDKDVKLLCVVNPSNPPSYTLSQHALDRIADVVHKDNHDLMIITDDVYGTFVPDFKSLMYRLPHNTMTVYSFSKYFGATGWRLAVIALNQLNIFDALIEHLCDKDKKALNTRYGSLTLEPEKMKFIDRMVADSRMVALNHTAGLSTPQQMQMSFFAAYSLLDRENVYKMRMQTIINNRLDALWKTTGFTLKPDPLRAGYYSEIDIMVWAKRIYGDAFCEYLEKNYEPLDFVLRLANETAVVLLNGDGFAGPDWSVRISLANLDRKSYLRIGTAIRSILNEYHSEFRNGGKKEEESVEE